MTDPITAAKAAVLLTDKGLLKKALIAAGFIILFIFILLMLPLVIISSLLLVLNPFDNGIDKDVHTEAVAAVKSQQSIDNELPSSVVRTVDFIIDGELMTKEWEIRSFVNDYFVGTKTIEVEVTVEDPITGTTTTTTEKRTVKTFLSVGDIVTKLRAPPLSFGGEDIEFIETLYAEGSGNSGMFPPVGGIIGGEGVLSLIKGSASISRGLHDTGSASGVDIAAAKGTPVVAAFSGTVSYYICKSAAGEIVSYGAVAFQRSDDGKHSATYAHLSQFDTLSSYNDIAKLPSKPVYHADHKELHHTSYIRKGSVIGYVGNTGNSFGAHLHFGLMVDGKAVDPIAYLK